MTPARYCPKCGAKTVLYNCEEEFDPFMGGGSTAIAALELGRKFIGVELDPRWFDMASRRVEDAQKQMRLF